MFEYSLHQTFLPRIEQLNLFFLWQDLQLLQLLPFINDVLYINSITN